MFFLFSILYSYLCVLDFRLIRESANCMFKKFHSMQYCGIQVCLQMREKKNCTCKFHCRSDFVYCNSVEVRLFFEIFYDWSWQFVVSNFVQRKKCSCIFLLVFNEIRAGRARESLLFYNCRRRSRGAEHIINLLELVVV